MPRILVLPEHVANQIAAGEVVERPASVVKELVENAIDAGAERVSVEIAGVGLEIIRVIDDGVGMSREDLELAFMRHATSKMRVIDDLAQIRSLGFRGEALPSIASVAKVHVRTAVRGEPNGTELKIDGGKRVAFGDGSAAPGTWIEVADLFYNVPARRKFMKRRETELGHVAEIVERIALSHPNVGLRLVSDGRSLLDAPPGNESDPLGRVAKILGRGVAERLKLVPRFSLDELEVTGFIGTAELSERTARGVRVFLNGRFVRDRTIQSAITEAYRGILPPGRFPVVLLSLSMDPGRVDVNVHPQKLEVRFQNPQEVYRAVYGAIRRALPVAGPPPAEILREAREPEPAPTWTPPTASPAWTRPSSPPTDAPRSSGHYDALRGAVSSIARDRGPSAEQIALYAPPPEGRFSSLTYLGQTSGGHLLCEATGRVVILDPKAAEHRVAIARLSHEHRARSVAVQMLLVPEPLSVENALITALADAEATLEDLGFQVQARDGGLVLLAAPAALDVALAKLVVVDLLADLHEIGDSAALDRILERALLRAATANIGGDRRRMSGAEVKVLLAALDGLEAPYLGAAGAPFFVEWSMRDLDRLFRTS